jgi:hypothetical protein
MALFATGVASSRERALDTLVGTVSLVVTDLTTVVALSG